LRFETCRFFFLGALAPLLLTYLFILKRCRAPGTVEGIAMIENIMENVAMIVGKDPLKVRLANIPKNSKVRSILQEITTTAEYSQRRAEIEKFNADNRWIKRGIAILPMKYHLGYFGSQNALVSVYYADATVSISHGGIEMGQGLNTKVAQTAAYILGIPIEKISIKPTNNFTAPNAIVTGGSQGSDISCFAVQKACEIIKARLEPIKKANPNDDWSKIIQKAFAQNIDLMASYFFKASDIKEYDIWGAACSEVEVDVLTGSLLINRVDILEDLGESMSPGVDIGQIEGAFVMGLGYYLTEQLVYDKQTGELKTNRSWNYKVPGAKDIPIDFRVKFLQNSSNPFGVLRSKAVGEPATCLAFSVIMALRHALNSARKDSGIKTNEFYHLGAPSTTETIFMAANNVPEQFLLS
jgi:xanthine dehydrogenase/oxidase